MFLAALFLTTIFRVDGVLTTGGLVSLNFSIVENNSPPNVLGRLDIGRELKSGDTVVYYIEEYDPSADADFGAGRCVELERDGLLTARIRFDREAVCPDLTTVDCNLSFGVLALVKFAAGGESRVQIAVQLAIIDVNDYVPDFDKPVYTIEVPEDQRPNTLVQPELPPFVDLDSPRNRVTECTLEIDPSATNAEQSEPLPFDLDVTKVNVDNNLVVERVYLRLKPGAQLDRERTAAYSMILRARDGQPDDLTYNTATMTIRVSVQDVNDNDPVIEPMYNVTVREDVPIGTRLVQLEASDRDSGKNGAIRYSIPVADRPRIGQQLELNAVTGEIVSKRLFNYELRNLYQFTVLATDSGSPARSAFTTIAIHILDTNDERPQVCIVQDESDANAACQSLESGEAPIAIEENLAPNTIVAKLRVSDSDASAAFRELSCEPLPRHLPFYLDRLPNEFGKNVHYALRATSMLDREKQASYSLPIVCSDGNSLSALSVTQTLSVLVADENDNAPVFENDRVTLERREQEPLVIRIKPANDTDAAENGTVRYYLQDGHGKFQIDPVTAILTTEALDREERPMYEVVVVAHDLGNATRLSSSVVYEITLIDVNDHAPLVAPSYTFHIREDYFNDGSRKVLEFGNLNVTDADEGDNAEFTCELIGSPHSLTRHPLSVDSNCQVFFIATALDRERISQYNATVRVTDKGRSKSLTSTTQVRVVVEDVNDCSPAVSFPPDGMNITFHVSLLDPTLNHNKIVRVIATDADAPNHANSRLQYALTGASASSDIFTIDSATGDVYVRQNRTLFVGDLEQYRIDVLVSDCGEPQHSSVVTFKVHLRDMLAESMASGLSDRSIANVLTFIGIVVGLLVVVSILVTAIMLAAQRLRASSKANGKKTRTPARPRSANNDPSRAPLNAALTFTLESDSAACSPHALDSIGCLMCDTLTINNASCFAAPDNGNGNGVGGGSEAPPDGVHMCASRPCVVVASGRMQERDRDRAFVDSVNGKLDEFGCDHYLVQQYPAYVQIPSGTSAAYYSVMSSVPPCHCPSDEGFSQTRTSDSNNSSVVRFPAVCQDHVMKIDPSAASTLQQQLQQNNNHSHNHNHNLNFEPANDEMFPLHPPASPPSSTISAAFVPKSLFANGPLRQQQTIKRVAAADSVSDSQQVVATGVHESGANLVPTTISNANANVVYATSQSIGARAMNGEKKKNTAAALQLNAFGENINNSNSPSGSLNRKTATPAAALVAASRQAAFCDSTVV